MNLETIFLETYKDILSKLESNTEYSLIKACGLLRLLFLDKHPLAYKISNHLSVPLRFNISDLTDDPRINKGTLFSWNSPAPWFRGTREVHLNVFLKAGVLYHFGQWNTVKDIILASAHIMGGVHFGEIKTEKERIINEYFQNTLSELIPPKISGSLFEILGNSPNIGYRSIQDIIKVSLAGLKPLVEKLH